MALNLWTEIIISGFFYLLAIFFLVLKLMKVSDLSFFASLKDYLALSSVGIVVVSYLLGILMLRVMPVILGPAARFIEKRISRQSNAVKGTVTSHYQVEYVQVLQYGSTRLHWELDFQFSTLTLLRQLVVAVPFLVLTSTLWLADTTQKHLVLPVVLIFMILEVCIIIAYQRQKIHYRQLRDAAFNEAKKVQKQSK